MYDLTEEQQLIKKTAAEFADKRLKPHAAKWDAEAKLDLSVLKELAELGMMGMAIPEEYGGAGLGNFELVLVLEELNRCCPSTGVTVSVHNSLAQGPINKFGTPEQKKKYLPKLTNASWIGAYCLTEPNAGSDSANQQTMAVRDGNHYVLNGAKIFITNGEFADFSIVFARTDKTQRTKGISCFLVERDFPGYKIGSKEKKMGIRASSTTEILLEDCRVPVENLLGGEGNGFKIAMDTLNGGRIGIAAQSVGIMQACLDYSLQYARDRVCFGKPIAEFESIQWKLADMATQLDAARMLTYRAAKKRDEGEEVALIAAMAKLFASRHCNMAAKEAVQILGGYGYIREYPVERFFRDARITELYEGTTEVQRLVIAKQLMK